MNSIDKRNLNVLMISLDESLLEERGAPGDSFARHLDYARKVKSIDIVVVGKNKDWTVSKDNLSIYGIGKKSLPGRLVSGSQAIKRLAESKEYSLVTSQDPFMTGHLATKISRRKGIPFNLQLHADFIDNRYWVRGKPVNRLLRFYSKSLIRKADTIRVVSSRMAEKLLKMGIEEKRIYNVPTGCGIDVARFGTGNSAAIRKKFNIPDGSIVVLFVGRMVKQKSLDDLVAAASIVLKENKDVLFLLVGDGPERERIRDYIESEGITDNVRFTGRLSYAEVADCNAAADIFVLTSVYEGTARVLEEAAASRLPIVTTLVSGAEDVVEDAKSGFIVDVHDPGRVAEKVLLLAGNKELRTAMGKRGREIAEQKYDRSRNLDKLIDMWKETAERRRS